MFSLLCAPVRQANKSTIWRIVILADLTINTSLQWRINLLEMKNNKKRNLNI